MSKLKSKNMVPMDNVGEVIKIYDDDLKKALPVASKRTHMLGLKAGVGQITIKEALCAAYFQGIRDVLCNDLEK